MCALIEFRERQRFYTSKQIGACFVEQIEPHVRLLWALENLR